ncbi:MAG: ribosomal-processing cysteine protease Prp [Eubacteriales bacterium]|nr:ribosomal-processing cysteine protease Prp [Eubacteriales bacterium]
MTTILIRKTRDDYRGFTCTGHAGYADSGSDIVCAAVSVLVINTMNAIEAYASQRMEAVMGEEDGVIDVSFPDPVNDRTKLLLDTMVLGLTDIEKQYGKKYLRLKFEEV